MNILGSVGSLYMAILILLLIIGFGLIGLKFVNYILNLEQIQGYNKIIDKQETNKWLKIALGSFIGILLSVFTLAIINST